MMKKTLLLALLGLILLCAAACGGTPEPTPTPTPTLEVSAEPTPIPDVWPEAFAAFPAFKGDGKLEREDVGEDKLVRNYSGMSQESVDTYMELLREDGFTVDQGGMAVKSDDQHRYTFQYGGTEQGDYQLEFIIVTF